MKTTRSFLAFLCLTLVLTAAPVTAQEAAVRKPPMSADEAAIRRVPEGWIQFYNAGDAAKVAALYTDDAYYLSAHILARKGSGPGVLGTRHQSWRAHRFY